MTNLADLNYCITIGHGIWNLYATEATAYEALARLQAERGDEFKDSRVMLFDDWNNSQEGRYLDEPLKEIDEEGYWYALEVLPPVQWTRENGIERFCMSEFTYGQITNQYATIKNGDFQRYFVKAVRFNDRSTYIDAQMIRSYDADQARARSTRPGDEAAIYAEETGCDYSTALARCNMD